MMNTVRKTKWFSAFLAIVLSFALLLTGGPLQAFAYTDYHQPLLEEQTPLPDFTFLPDSWLETEPPDGEMPEEGYYVPEIGQEVVDYNIASDNLVGAGNAVTISTSPAGDAAPSANVNLGTETVTNNVYGEQETNLPVIPEVPVVPPGYYEEYYDDEYDEYEIIFALSISGLVKSSETDLALAGAVVSLVYEEQLVVSVIADSEGRYYLPEMYFFDESLGEWVIVVSYEGYQTIYECLVEWIYEYMEDDYYGYDGIVNLGDITINFYLEAEVAAWDGIITISGVVTSSEGSTPLEDVLVELITTDMGAFATLTNEKGFYEILIHPTGEESLDITAVLLDSELTASLEGFLTKTVDINDYINYVDENGKLTINIELKPGTYIPEGYARVFGVVTLEEELVEGAIVEFSLFDPYDWFSEEEPKTFRATTNAEGKYSILLPATVDIPYTAWATYTSIEYVVQLDAYGNLQLDEYGYEVLERVVRIAISENVELKLVCGDLVEVNFELEWVEIEKMMVTIHHIYTPLQLSQFLQGTLGQNTDTFILMNPINMAGWGAFQGRPFDAFGRPFQGLFDGGGNTITGLTLAPRPEVAPGFEPPGHNDIGFIRVMGQGAEVRDVTFANPMYSDAETNLTTWNGAVGSIGLVVGRVIHGAATIENVNITNGSITFGGARGITNKNVGGVAGFVNSGAVLSINNVNASVAVALNTTGTATSTLPSVGGLIGVVEGSANIRGNEVTLATSIAPVATARTIQHTGGAIGRIVGSGATLIENLTVRGTLNNAITTGGFVGSNTTNVANSLVIRNSHNHATTSTAASVAGGFVGIATMATIENSTNHAAINIGTGIAGGFVGQGTSPMLNAINLQNVVNNGPITGNTTAGGFVGSGNSVRIAGTPESPARNTGTITSNGHLGGFIGTATGTVVVEYAENNPAVANNNGLVRGGGPAVTAAGTTAQGNIAVGGIVGSMNAGSVTLRNVVNRSNIEVTQGRLGGLIGRTIGAGQIRIYDSINHGNIRNASTASAAGAAVRNRISSSGGFIGQADGTLHIIGGTNYGAIRGHGQNGTGGIVGTTAIRAGSTTTLIDVENRGNVHGQHSRRQVGGIIGHARNTTTLTNATSYGALTLDVVGSVSATINAVGGLIGQANGLVNINNGTNYGNLSISSVSARDRAGSIRMGGIIGISLNRVTINSATNHGNIWITGSNLSRGNMGGIIGRMQWPATAANRTANLNDVVNHGNIGYNTANAANTTGIAGGIVGASWHRTRAGGLHINGAFNTGNIHTGTGSSAGARRLTASGGIVGVMNTLNSTISNAVNQGRVIAYTATGTANGVQGAAGGIVGRASRNNLAIMNSGNEGIVRHGGTATSTSNIVNSGAGGIIGTIERGTNIRILRSFNSGAIEAGTTRAGGIVGSIRRRGNLLIQDAYNIGSVRARNTIVAAQHAGTGALPAGHGILGHRSVNRGIITIERVFNAGNVHGSPIFYHTGGSVRNRNRMANSMLYRDVFFDTSIHTGVAQTMQPGIVGTNTSVLTSGGLQAFQHPNWMTRGWIENLLRGYRDSQDPFNPEDWETYPWLSWQTPATRDIIPPDRSQGHLHPSFFGQVVPGADHLTTVPNRIVHFNNVVAGSRTVTGGNEIYDTDPIRDVRSFIPYGDRGNIGANANTTAANRTHVARAEGSHTDTVTRAINQRLSVGMIDPQGVVGFNGNELFDDVVVIGVDGPDWAGGHGVPTVVTWSRMYRDNARLQTNVPPGSGIVFEQGIANLPTISAGQVIRVEALGYVTAFHTITPAEVDRFQQYESLLIVIPMERAPIPNLRLHVLSEDHIYESGPNEGRFMQIPAVYDPRGLSSRIGTISPHPNDAPLNILAPWTPPLPSQTALYQASGSQWRDILGGRADGFAGANAEYPNIYGDIALRFTDIRGYRPDLPLNAQPTLEVHIMLEYVRIPDGALAIIRFYEDADGIDIMARLPHGGGPAGVWDTTPRGTNPGLSGITAAGPRFAIYFRCPLIGYNTRVSAGIGTGSGTPTTNPTRLGPSAGPYSTPATIRATSDRWWMDNATRFTEVRVVPLDGFLVPGRGLDRPYRATPWMNLYETREYDPESEAEYPPFWFYAIPVEWEYPARASVRERFTVIGNHEFYRPVPGATLVHERDMGEDSGYGTAPILDMNPIAESAPGSADFGFVTPHNPAIPNADGFNFAYNIRILEGERFIARAPGFVEADGTADYVYTEAVMPDIDFGEDANAPNIVLTNTNTTVETTYLFMERERSGRIYGFVMDQYMYENPDATDLAYIRNMTVIVMNEDGQEVRRTTSGDSGFFEVWGLPAGNYTVIAMDLRDPASVRTWAHALSVPNPVVLTIDPTDDSVSNARVNVFMHQDRDRGFPIFVRVSDSAGNNITDRATATLTYEPDGLRTSAMEGMYQVIWASLTNTGWRSTGEVEVKVDLFIPAVVNIPALIIEQAAHADYYLFIDVTLSQSIDNLLVYVVQDPAIPRMAPVIIRTAQLTYTNPTGAPVVGTPVPYAGAYPNYPYTGPYTGGVWRIIPYAYVGNVLTASAIGFGTVERVVTPEDAISGIITITLSETKYLDDFEVRVFSERTGQLITLAYLLQPPATASESGYTGVFVRNDLRVGDTVIASAPGYRSVSQIVYYGDANAGFMTIILRDEDREPFTQTVRVVRDSDGMLIETATLEQLSDDNINITRNADGTFNIANALVGNRLFADAPGFTGREHLLSYLDVNPGYITIRLVGDQQVTLEFVVTGTPAAFANRLPAAWLTHPTIATDPEPANSGRFRVTVTGNDIGEPAFAAGAEGFNNGSHLLTAQDLVTEQPAPYPALIAGAVRRVFVPLTYGYYTDATTFTVTVREVGATDATGNIPHALLNLTARPNVLPPTITPVLDGEGNTTGVFTVVIPGAGAYIDVVPGLEASAIGYTPNNHVITREDLLPPHEITIYLTPVTVNNLEVRVVDSDGNLIDSNTTLTVAGRPGATLTPDLLNPGRWVVSGVYINDVFTADADGFNYNTGVVTATAIYYGTMDIVLIQDIFELRISSVPTDLTHIGKTAYADGALYVDGTVNNIMFGTTVVKTAGEVEENHYFLGWYRMTPLSVIPEVGMHVLDDLVGDIVRDEDRSFNKPASDTEYFALWGARDIIGAPAAQIRFNFYGVRNDQGQPATPKVPYIAVPVAFGEALDQNLLAEVSELVEYYGGTAFAFWGWFTAADFQAENRIMNNHRRPTVGTEGFNIPVSFTQAEFEALAVDGIIDLYTVWAKWGDVNDDDRVDIVDFDIFRMYIAGGNYPIFNRAPAKVARGASVTIADFDMIRMYISGTYVVLGRPPVQP